MPSACINKRTLCLEREPTEESVVVDLSKRVYMAKFSSSDMRLLYRNIVGLDYTGNDYNALLQAVHALLTKVCG